MNWLRTMVAQSIDPKLEQVQEMIRVITFDDALYELRLKAEGVYDLFLDYGFGPQEGYVAKWKLVGTGSLDEIIKSLEQEYRESLRKNSGEYYG